MKTLYELLQGIKDHRRSQGQRISLAAFLEMIVLAGMSGHFGINSIKRFIDNNEAYFVERYGLHHGVPSQGSVFNNLKNIDHAEFHKAVRLWMKQYVPSNQDFWIAIDGKALASTVTDRHGSNQNFKCMVSMFSHDLGVVLNAESMENKKKENGEGEAARNLIAQLEVKGVTFTMDALHCQKKPLKPSWSQEMTM